MISFEYLILETSISDYWIAYWKILWRHPPFSFEDKCWQNKKSCVAKILMMTIARNIKAKIGRLLEDYLSVV